MPILQEGHLQPHNSRTLQLKMSVPPCAKNAQSQIFVTGIQTSKESNPSIDNYQLAVVAEVDLKAPAKLSIGDKSLNGHTRVAQLVYM